MKHLISIPLIFSILFISSFSAEAQFSKSTKLASAGIAMGLYGKYYHDFSEANLDRMYSPPVSLQYETGLSEESGLGELSQYVTAGVFVGFQGQRFSKDVMAPNITYEVYKKYLYLWGGIVGSFHGVPLINENTTLNLDASKWDLYVSLKSGFVLERYNSNYENDPTDIQVQAGIIDIKQNKTFFYIGPVVGARYYFADQFAVYAEIGRANLSNMSVGATMKL